MSTQKVTSEGTSEAGKSETKVHPAPGLVWMILPVALLGLLAYLARG